MKGTNEHLGGRGGDAKPASPPTATVQRLERLLGGDPATEAQILQFIAAHFGAVSLCDLPPQIAAEICRRPADFIRAAKNFCQPELF
ncbi:MAG: hypothetical protein BWX68_02184 [Verrucomicrobia bacterium ADurb.Bin063]|jgi:hypothetical protein|nr:MAG: hypothetical protein BWX68_02184 [Verrucomicrobia bacterium ADurb.Bin063]